MIQYLAEELADSPILMFCLARPVFLDEEPEWAQAMRQHRLLELQPLEPPVAARLAEHLLRHLQGDVSTLAEEVARRSDGNPFYAEEIIRDLVDRGVVRIADTTRWLLVGNADTIEVPSTVEGVLQARLDRLSPRAREVLHLSLIHI